MAYEQFTEPRLHRGESVDVYLAVLRKLAVLFGLACAFIRGLLEQVKGLLRASTRMDALAIALLLDRVRAIMKHGAMEDGPAVSAA